MQIGMMGLGRMGANMVRRLLRAGHQCVVYDIDPASVAALVKEGATGAASVEEFVGKLEKPRSAWLMLPAAITRARRRPGGSPDGRGRHRHRRRQLATIRRRSTRRRSSPPRASTSSMSAPAAASGASNEAIA